jgi:hypothetical protein
MQRSVWKELKLKAFINRFLETGILRETTEKACMQDFPAKILHTNE